MIAASMVVVPVTDLERAKQFYGDVLGLTLVSETRLWRALPLRVGQRDLDLQAGTSRDGAHAGPLRGR